MNKSQLKQIIREEVRSILGNKINEGFEEKKIAKDLFAAAKKYGLKPHYISDVRKVSREGSARDMFHIEPGEGSIEVSVSTLNLDDQEKDQFLNKTVQAIKSVGLDIAKREDNVGVYKLSVFTVNKGGEIKKSVNEDLGTIALGVMGGIGLYKILKFALKKVGVAVGSRVSLPKESLHNIINETNKALIQNFIKGDKTLDMMQITLLTKVLKDYVDDGTIKSAKDIQAYAERAMKAMVKNDSSINEDQ